MKHGFYYYRKATKDFSVLKSHEFIDCFGETEQITSLGLHFHIIKHGIAALELNTDFNI